MARLKAIMAGKIERRETETPGYDIYPKEMTDLYRQRTFAIGEEMYGRLGIPREDKRARAIWFARNFQFFGAPAAYFVTVDRRMGPPQWADLGMYLQNLMLLAVEHGLATCPQECWAVFPTTVEAFLGTPAERMLFCGVAIGHEDKDDPANLTRSARAPEEEWLTVLA
jgi:nitroreductase